MGPKPCAHSEWLFVQVINHCCLSCWRWWRC